MTPEQKSALKYATRMMVDSADPVPYQEAVNAFREIYVAQAVALAGGRSNVAGTILHIHRNTVTRRTPPESRQQRSR